MPARKSFNQLDPFGENEDRFQTREIRSSRSRSSKDPFVNVEKKDEGKSKNNTIILGAVLVVVLLGVIVLLILLPQSAAQDPTVSEDPLVNPTGRDATSEYTADTDNPELRAREQNKIDTLLSLLNDEDWEYANATFETIFPDYLDTCGRYEYYRAAVVLADNFEDFTISRDTAESRLNYLLEKCDNAGAE